MWGLPIGGSIISMNLEFLDTIHSFQCSKSLKIVLINIADYDLEQSMVQVGKTASLVEETDT